MSGRQQLPSAHVDGVEASPAASIHPDVVDTLVVVRESGGGVVLSVERVGEEFVELGHRARLRVHRHHEAGAVGRGVDADQLSVGGLGSRDDDEGEDNCEKEG